MKNRLFIFCLILCFCFSISTSAYASIGEFSFKQQEKTKNNTGPSIKEERVWLTSIQSQPSGCTVQCQMVGYQFDRYVEDSTAENVLKYHYGTVSYVNRDSGPGNVEYMQEETKGNTAEFSGSASATFEFKAAIIAKIEGSTSYTVTTSHTEYESTTVKGSHEISPWSVGNLAYYLAGKYSGGKGYFNEVWQDYYGQRWYVPAYYQTGDAWQIEVNHPAFDYWETPYAH